MAYLYAGSLYRSTPSVLNLRQYDAADGTDGWSVGSPENVHGYDTYAVAVDGAGNVYAAGYRYSSITTRKYNSAGTQQWRVDHGANVQAIAVDASGNVYTGGVRTSNLTTRKYSSSGGSPTWSVDHGDQVNAIAVDSSGNVFTGGNRTSSLTTRKYDSSGTLQWSKDHGATIWAVAVDASGNVYAAGTASSSITIRKYNSSGTQQWTADTSGTCNALAVDEAAGLLYACGNTFIRRFALSDGTENTDDDWPITAGITNQLTIAVDADGNVYTGCSTTSGKTTIAWDSTGTEIWSDNNGTTVRGVAVTQDRITRPPGLPISWGLATPFPTGIVTVPALSIAFSLGAPTGFIPEIPTGTGALVYRCYIAGDAGVLLEYPLASLQCRRRRNDSTWLAVSLSSLTRNQVSVLEPLVGRLVIVVYGWRNPDGSETLEEFLRGILTEVSSEQDAYRGTATLDCRIDAVNETLQTRTLTGIREVQNDNGRRMWRCTDIQHRLRPGDTVTDGVTSFVAYSVQYAISPGDQWMSVQEEG